MSGIINFLHINTAPGHDAWCSPPRSVTDYQAWLVDILSRSQRHQQGFGLLESFYRRSGYDPAYPEEKPVIEGPFKDELIKALTVDFKDIVAKAKAMREIREEADKELQKQRKKEETAAQKATKKTKKKSGPSVEEQTRGMTISDMAKERNASFLSDLQASLSG